MPNQIGPHVGQRIVAFALGHPGYGARRISAELAREKWGAIRISERGMLRVLCRVGLNTGAKRVALVARNRDPYECRPLVPRPGSAHRRHRSGEKVRLDCSTSGGCRAPRATSANTQRSTSPPRSAGRSCTPPSATCAHGTPASCCTASRANWRPPDGSSRRSPSTTARSPAPNSSATLSSNAAPTNG